MKVRCFTRNEEGDCEVGDEVDTYTYCLILDDDNKQVPGTEHFKTRGAALKALDKINKEKNAIHESDSPTGMRM